MIRSAGRFRNEGVLTTVSIGVLAYVIAAVVHEAIGHGGMCLALGGHLRSLTSLFPQCTIQSPAIALAGPLANVIFGLLALWALVRLGKRAPAGQLQLFVWLSAAYNLFFGTGYLLFSGLTGEGDWSFAFGVDGVNSAERLLLIGGGILAVVASMRLIARSTPPAMLAARGEVRRDRTLAIYVAATLVAIGAAALDPAGIRTVLSLPPAAPFAGLGLFWLRRVARRSSADGGLVLGVGCHRGWLLAGASSAILFIGVLGPGIVFD